MTGETAGLLAVAGAFAALNGANDGGALTSVGLGVRGIRPLAAIVALGLAMVAAPLAFGTAVATTLTNRLVNFQDQAGRLPFVAALLAAVLVTLILSAQGLPTSITLALVGGITGAGLGASLSVSWSAVAAVLAAAALAPVVGMAAGRLLGVLMRRVRAKRGLYGRMRSLHALGFAGVCLAYGANDGQKVLAVFALLLGMDGDVVRPKLVPLLAGAALFVLGAILGVRRFRATVGGGVVAVRPDQTVTTELSATAVVLSTAAVGAPVSMSQSVSGALIGAAWDSGTRRVRWRVALRMVLAWLVTFPTALVAAALAALAAGAIQ
jgi:PiT family inorganic phosphate transporter